MLWRPQAQIGAGVARLHERTGEKESAIKSSDMRKTQRVCFPYCFITKLFLQFTVILGK